MKPNFLQHGHNYLRKLRGLPPGVLFRKLRRKSENWLLRKRAIHRDLISGTYVAPPRFSEPSLGFRLPSDILGETAFDAATTGAVQSLLNHEFDLLGSGRLRIEGSPPQVNASNQAESQRIRMLIHGPYSPIDWQVDFKSGHRWPAQAHSYTLGTYVGPGVDIKVPWELARMQHLPPLGLFCLHGRQLERTNELAENCVREVRNQILDFIAANPPRFGVNWACTMDVAIRAANWVVALDLLHAAGVTWDSSFEHVVTRSLYEHGLHIVNHLEWNEELRNNHYLADLAGLSFIAGYLPRSQTTDAWLALTVQELMAAVAEQFLPEGANFEGSTSYHRLSAEMVAWATAWIQGLPPSKLQALKEYDARLISGQPRLRPAPLAFHSVAGRELETPFPDWYWERLGQMAHFTLAITRPDGCVPQIGDNDSGRFLSLQPLSVDAAENVNNHGGLVALIEHLLETGEVTTNPVASSAEGAIIRGLAGAGRDPKDKLRTSDVRPGTDVARPFSLEAKRSIPAETSLSSWPGFGLYVFRAKNVYLAVRCGPIGQNGYGGHAHNDQLSFELALAGHPIVVDPGTFVYTADLDERNRFRSTRMHNTLCLDGHEQNDWPVGWAGAFRAYDQARAKVLHIGPSEFVGVHYGFGVPVERRLSLQSDRLMGIDQAAHPGMKSVRFHLAPTILMEPKRNGAEIRIKLEGLAVVFASETGDWTIERDWYSPAYGLRQPAWTLNLRLPAKELAWEIRWLDEPLVLTGG